MIFFQTSRRYLRTALASRTAKHTYLMLGLAVLSFAPHVLAADGFVPLAPIPGLTDETTVGSVIGSDTLATFFNNLYKYLIGVAATIAIIEIIWGGLEIATNRDNAGKILDAKGRIVQAIFGLILVLSPVLVFSIINPSILNLSLSLKPIKTLSTPADTTTDASVPEGGTIVPFGATTPVGTWCYSSTPRTQSYGQTAPICFADEATCSSALANAKATANGTVDLRAVCLQQQ